MSMGFNLQEPSLHRRELYQEMYLFEQRMCRGDGKLFDGQRLYQSENAEHISGLLFRDNLYREHPMWNPPPSVRDNDPDDDWF